MESIGQNMHQVWFRFQTEDSKWLWDNKKMKMQNCSSLTTTHNFIRLTITFGLSKITTENVYTRQPSAHTKWKEVETKIKCQKSNSVDGTKFNPQYYGFKRIFLRWEKHQTRKQSGYKRFKLYLTLGFDTKSIQQWKIALLHTHIILMHIWDRVVVKWTLFTNQQRNISKQFQSKKLLHLPQFEFFVFAFCFWIVFYS